MGRANELRTLASPPSIRKLIHVTKLCPWVPLGWGGVHRVEAAAHNNGRGTLERSKNGPIITVYCQACHALGFEGRARPTDADACISGTKVDVILAMPGVPCRVSHAGAA